MDHTLKMQATNPPNAENGTYSKAEAMEPKYLFCASFIMSTLVFSAIGIKIGLALAIMYVFVRSTYRSDKFFWHL